MRAGPGWISASRHDFDASDAEDPNRVEMTIERGRDRRPLKSGLTSDGLGLTNLDRTPVSLAPGLLAAPPHVMTDDVSKQNGPLARLERQGRSLRAAEPASKLPATTTVLSSAPIAGNVRFKPSEADAANA